MWADLKYAARGLLKRPGFSLAVIVTLALGLGANAALFSVAHALLFRALPFADPDRLIAIEARLGGEAGRLSAREVRDIGLDSRTIADVAAHYPSQYNLTGGGQPEALVTTIGTSSLFRVLGVTPLHGDIWPASADWTRQYMVVLNHGLWLRRYGGDPAIVGRSVRLDGADYQVAGVLPPGFDYPTRADIFRAVTEFYSADTRRFSVVARLRPGFSASQAQTELDDMARRFAAMFPATNQGVTFRARPLRDLYVGHLRPYVLLLGGAVAFVLLIACANIANLLLSRAMARHGEVAIRTALGASRFHIVRQGIVEALLLAGAGGVVAIGVARLGIGVLTSLARVDLPFWFHVDLDWRLLAFTAALSLVTGIAVGLVPARQASRVDVHDVLKLDARRTTGGAGSPRLREALVMVEVASTVLLLVGAMLMVKSLLRLRAADPGFDAASLLTLRTDPPWSRYEGLETIATFYRRAIEQIQTLPGVEGAATNMVLPLAGVTDMTRTVLVEGRVADRAGEQPVVNYQVVSPDYFRVMKIPLLAGRVFTAHDADRRDRGPGEPDAASRGAADRGSGGEPGAGDSGAGDRSAGNRARATSLPVAIVSARAAQRFWPGEDAIGKRIRTIRRIHGSSAQNSEEVTLTIVGVVGPVTFAGLTDSSGLDLYTPQDQTYAGDTFFVVRARDGGDPRALARAVTHAIQQVDPEQSVFDVQSMDERVDRLVWQQRASGAVLTMLAGLALVLAAVGIYAVLANAIRRRRREVGIRVALGARRADVIRLVLWQGMRPVWIGMTIGLAAALLGAWSARHLLYDVAALDPITFAAVPFALALVALAACYAPLHHAVRVDPVEALRSE